MTKRNNKRKAVSLASMEPESELANRVETTLVIDPDLEPDIPNRNKSSIAPIEHDETEETIEQPNISCYASN